MAELRLPPKKNRNGHLTADDGKHTKGKKIHTDRDFIFRLGIGKHKREKDPYGQRFYI